MENETNAGETGSADTAATKGKSIIDPKYRGKYKTPDWLGAFIMAQTNNTRVLPAQEASPAVGEIGKEGYKPAREAKPERTVDDGVNVDKLFELGRKNGLNLDKFDTQRGSHGFDGRFRMTVRNMLQTIVKQRHGLYNLGGTFVSADPAFLSKVGILEGANPTHNQDGTKIPKAAKAAPEAAAGESKLIKADAVDASVSDAGERPAPAAVAKKKK